MLYDNLLAYLIRKKIRGKDRLYTLFSSLGFKELIRVKSKYGLVLNLNPYEYIDKVVIAEGFYESEVTDAILSLLGKNETFWDIGANIGLHSIAVKKNRPDVEVICFEPNPNTASLLFDNITLNSVGVVLCNIALFSKEDILDLYIISGNSGMTTLMPWADSGYSSTVKCLTTTGNSLVERSFNIPNIIKIDTEGSELEVLKGCVAFLGNANCKAIILEADNGITDINDELEIIAYLKGFGFSTVTQLSRNENTSHSLSNYVISK
jgi:FkbM family methyltransferase